jgi:hypothetical protein
MNDQQRAEQSDDTDPWRMPFPVILRRVTHVRIDISEEHIASIISVTRIDSCHPGDIGDKFLLIISSYKSHTAQHIIRRQTS